MGSPVKKMTLEWTIGIKKEKKKKVQAPGTGGVQELSGSLVRVNQMNHLDAGNRPPWSGGPGKIGPCILRHSPRRKKRRSPTRSTMPRSTMTDLYSALFSTSGPFSLSRVRDKCSLTCKAESLQLCHSSYRFPTYFYLSLCCDWEIADSEAAQ